MSSSVESTIEPVGFNLAVADIKQDVEAPTAAQSQASERACKTGRELIAFSQGMLRAYVQAVATPITEKTIAAAESLKALPKI